MSIAKGNKRINLGVDEDTYAQIELLAKKREMSVPDWVRWAIKIATEFSIGNLGVNGLMIERMNQLINGEVETHKSVDNMMDVLVNLQKMMNILLSGESYLNDTDLDENSQLTQTPPEIADNTQPGDNN